MIVKIDIKDTTIAKKVVALQKDSYGVEAEITGIKKLPPLSDTVKDMMVCNEVFFGYYEGEELAGIISFKTEENVLDIHRVAVNPKFFKKGIGTLLLKYIQENIIGVDEYVVSTSVKNKPAIDLYLKNGF